MAADERKEEKRFWYGIERRATNVSKLLHDLPDPVQSDRKLMSPAILVEQAQGIAAHSRTDSVLLVCEIRLRG